MGYDIRHLKSLGPRDAAVAHSVRRVRLDDGAEINVIHFDRDTYVHPYGVQDHLSRGASCSAYIAHRLGDLDPAFCVRRFDRQPDTSAAIAAARVEHLARARLVAQSEATSTMFTAGDVPWGTVEPLGHCSLEEVSTRRHQVAPSDLAVLTLHVARDLQSMHAAGLRHGDVKPLNVLVQLGPSPRLRLIDFDQSTPAESLIGQGFYYGLREFVMGRPPECGLCGHDLPSADPPRTVGDVLAGDVYALAYMVCRRVACLVHQTSDVELIALLPSFEAARRGAPITDVESVSRAALDRLGREFEIVRSLPHELASLLLDMLAIAPADRPTIDEVVARLERSDLVSRPTQAIWFRKAAMVDPANLAGQGARLHRLIGNLEQSHPEWLRAAPATPSQCAESRALADAQLQEPARAMRPASDVDAKKKTQTPAQRESSSCWTAMRMEAARLFKRIRSQSIAQVARARSQSAAPTVPTGRLAPVYPSCWPAGGMPWLARPSAPGQPAWRAPRGLHPRCVTLPGPRTDEVLQTGSSGPTASSAFRHHALSGSDDLAAIVESTCDLPGWCMPRPAQPRAEPSRTWSRDPARDALPRGGAPTAGALRRLRASIGLATPTHAGGAPRHWDTSGWETRMPAAMRWTYQSVRNEAN